MKTIRIMLIAASIAVISAHLCGCFTSAKAYTKTINPDGTETISFVGVVGTGDKASQVAAEGLFADGAPDAFGAGVKSASANQTSTGIDGTLAGLGSLMQGMAQFAAVMQSGGIVGGTAPKIQAAGSNSDTVIDMPAIGAKTIAPSAPKSAISGEGGNEVVILGNRTTCSLCRALWGKVDASALRDELGVNVIDADKTDNADVYTSKRPPNGVDWNWPWVRIYSGGVVVSEFSGRGLSQSDIAAKAKAVLN